MGKLKTEDKNHKSILKNIGKLNQSLSSRCITIGKSEFINLLQYQPNNVFSGWAFTWRNDTIEVNPVDLNGRATTLQQNLLSDFNH